LVLANYETRFQHKFKEILSFSFFLDSFIII
jgi:hypothetical protein